MWLTQLSLALGLLSGAPAPAETAPPVEDRIAWFQGSFEGAVAQAGKEKHPILLYFWMDESEHCKRMYQDTLTSEEGTTELGSFVCMSARATEAAGSALVQRFGVSTLPTVLVLNEKGEREDAILGFVPKTSFVQELQRMRRGDGTVSALKKQADAAPDDLALRFQLADKLAHVGDATGARALVDSIKRDDPKGRTVIGAQLALYDLMSDIRSAASDATDTTTYDLEPMYDHVPRIKPKEVLFEAWGWLAATELGRGNRKEARSAYTEAWKAIPDDRVLDWAPEVVFQFWDMRDELVRKEKSFILSVATAHADRALALLERDPDDPEAPPLPDIEGTLEGFVARSWSGLAMAYSMNGKRKKAITTIERALELDPGSTDLQALLDQFQAKR